MFCQVNWNSKKKQAENQELKNSINNMNNTLESIRNRAGHMEERISE